MTENTTITATITPATITPATLDAATRTSIRTTAAIAAPSLFLLASAALDIELTGLLAIVGILGAMVIALAGTEANFRLIDRATRR